MERNIQSAGPMTKKRMEEYFESFNNQGEAKTFSTYYVEDAVFETAWDKKISGVENIIKYMRDVPHHGGKIKEILTPLKILIDGDDLAVELTAELEALEDVPDYHIGSFMKGEKIKWLFTAIYKIRDGKIAHVKLYIVLEEWARKWLNFQSPIYGHS